MLSTKYRLKAVKVERWKKIACYSSKVQRERAGLLGGSFQRAAF